MRRATQMQHISLLRNEAIDAHAPTTPHSPKCHHAFGAAGTCSMKRQRPKNATNAIDADTAYARFITFSGCSHSALDALLTHLKAQACF